MKFIIILLLICVLSGLSLVLATEDAWFAATSDVIHIRCDGLNHDVEIAWTKFGTLAMSIFNTKGGSVKMIGNAVAYLCTAQVYDESGSLMAAFHLKVDTISASTSDENQGSLEDVTLPQKSTVKCRSARSDEPNFVLDWANAVYSPESRRTTVFGNFEGIPNVYNSSENVFTCSEESDSESTYDNVRVTWEKVLPPEIRLIPSKQVVTIDETAEVACEVNGNDPADSIRWYTRDSNSELHFLAYNNLYFRNISIQAAGEYYCMAQNAAGWSRKANLVVETIPCS